MQVFLTGGTGFVGSYVRSELLRQNHQVRCLVRPGSTPKLGADSGRVEIVYGSVTDPHSIADKCVGCDAVIHLVGIVEEHPRQGVTFEAVHYEGTVNVVNEAQKSGVSRFIQMSANGARPDGVSAYQTSKWRAEQYVQTADFKHWTIFRPSIIFGKPATGTPEFATRLANTLVKPFPVLPILGDGRYELQPVAVEVVAAAFVQALKNEAAAGQTYCVAGERRFTFEEVVDIITQALERSSKPKVHVPLWLAEPLIKAAAPTGLLPISPAQLRMLVDGNTCDSSAFTRDFEVTNRPFSSETLSYLRA